MDARLESVRRTLRGCLNSLAMINFKLSTELLYQIFHHVTAALRLPNPSYPAASNKTFVRQTLSITHVCRTWRAIALDMPSLWSEIDDSRAEVYRVFLARSKHVPICLTLSGMDEDSPAPLDQVSARVRTLYLSEYTMSRRYTDFPSFTLPRLECLIVHTPRYETLDIPRTSGLPFSAPNLRAVSLSLDCARFLIPGRFPTLTHLHISFQKVTAYTWLDCLPLIAQTPLLESLHLECGYERATGDPQPGRLTLSRLRHITLRGVNLDWILLFLECTHLPADARVAATNCNIRGPAEVRALPPLPLLADVDRVAVLVSTNEIHCVAAGTAGALLIGPKVDRNMSERAHGLPRAVLDGVPPGNVVELSVNVGTSASGERRAQAEAEHVCRLLRATPALRALRLWAAEDALCEVVGSAALAALDALEELVLRVELRSVGTVCAPVVSMARERARRGHALDRVGLQLYLDGDGSFTGNWIARSVSAAAAALTPAQEYVRSLTAWREDDAALVESAPPFSKADFWFGRHAYWETRNVNMRMPGWHGNWLKCCETGLKT